MSQHNPFQPPEANVEDPVPSYGPRPVAVQRACLLVLLSLAVGVVSLIPGLRPVTPGEAEVPGWVTLLIVLIFGGLTVWLTVNVYGARNWARWGLVGFLALGWLIGFSTLPEDMVSSPFFALLDMGCVAAEISACALPFFGPAAQWFRAVSAVSRRSSGG